MRKHYFVDTIGGRVTHYDCDCRSKALEFWILFAIGMLWLPITIYAVKSIVRKDPAVECHMNYDEINKNEYFIYVPSQNRFPEVEACLKKYYTLIKEFKPYGAWLLGENVDLLGGNPHIQIYQVNHLRQDQ